MIKTIAKVGFVVFLVALLGYAGLCVKVNVFDKATSAKTIALPDMKEAQYSVLIESTRQAYFTNSFDQFGSSSGKRLFILHGFWQLTGGKFIYIPTDSPPLDEAIFGIITVTRRAK